MCHLQAAAVFSSSTRGRKALSGSLARASAGQNTVYVFTTYLRCDIWQVWNLMCDGAALTYVLLSYSVCLCSARKGSLSGLHQQLGFNTRRRSSGDSKRDGESAATRSLMVHVALLKKKHFKATMKYNKFSTCMTVTTCLQHSQTNTPQAFSM